MIGFFYLQSACEASQVAVVVKSPPASAGEMATHSSILAWEIPWTEEEPGGLRSIGSQRLNTTERLSPSTWASPTPVFTMCSVHSLPPQRVLSEGEKESQFMRQVQEARRNPCCPLLPLCHEGPRTHQWESVIYREARYEPLNQLLYQNRKRRTMRTLMKNSHVVTTGPASAKTIKRDSQNMTQQKGNDTRIEGIFGPRWQFSPPRPWWMP